MNIIRILLLFVVILLFLMLVLFLNKGFDLTDEGFYLLKFNQIVNNEYDVSTFQKAYKMIFGFIEANIMNLRIIRLTLALFSSALLAYSLYKLIRFYFPFGEKPDVILLYSLVFIGGFMGYGYGPQTLSYNSMAGYFLVITISLFLILITSINNSSYWNFILTMLIGLMSFIVILSKIPSGVILILFLLLSLIIINIKATRKLFFILFFLIGIFLGSISFYLTNQSIIIELEQFNIARSILQDSSSHSSISLFINLLKTILGVVVFVGLGWIMILLFRRLENNFSNYLYNQYFQILASFIIAFIYWFWSSRNFLLLPIVLIWIWIIQQNIGPNRRIIKHHNNQGFIVMGLLFFGPFITTVGSSVSMFNSTVFSMALWFGLFYIGIYINKNNKFNILSIIILVSMSTTFFLHNYFYKPYRIGSLNNQTYNIKNVNDFENIKTDSETYNYINRTYIFLTEAGYRNGDTIIGISKLSGVIYLIEATAMGGAYWGGIGPTNLLAKNLHLNLLNKNLPKWLLYRGNDINSLYTAPETIILGNAGFPFANYELIQGEIEIPGENMKLFLLKLKNI